MPAYRSAGGLDDSIAGDGDRGFFGMNQRLQPNLLEAGEVVLSQNGRMDGYWHPRRQVVARTEPLTTGGDSLDLPFRLIDTPKSIISATVPTANTVRIEITGHGFADGSEGWATVADLAGDVEINGNQYLTYYDANNLEYTVTGITTISDDTGTLSQTPINDNAASEVRASCLFSDPSEENSEYVIVALQSVAKKVDISDYSVTDIEYPTGLTVGPNCDMIQAFDRVILFRDGERAFEWIPQGRQILVASRSGSTVTMNVREHGLTVGDSIIVSGLTGGTPPNGTQTVASVTSKDVFTFTVAGSATESYNSDDGVLRADFTLVPGGVYEQPEHIITSTGEFKLTDNIGSVIHDDYMEVGDIVEVVTGTRSSQASGLAIGQSYVVSKVFRENGTVLISNASAASVTGGEYDGLYKVTIDTSSPHEFIVGQPVQISGFSDTKIDGNRFVTGVVDSDTFEIHVTQNPSTSITGDETVGRQDGFEFIIDPNTLSSYVTDGESLSATPVFTKKVSSGLGFIHMPAPPWGVMFQRRLWTPYYYEDSGTSTSPSYGSRDIRDEVIASDILDSSTFDGIYSQFRCSAGTADYLVAMQPFYDDNLIVLNRNSIHNIKGTQGDLNDTQVFEMTKEIGCLARKSVVLKGSLMLFLSDDGVYSLEFLNDYNLRGTEEPLSKNIQPFIDRINKNLAPESLAVYYNNRYYIAVPLDSVTGANDANGNNTVLIYNFLNKGWESIDTYGSGDFFVNNMVIAGSGARNDLYAVSPNGVLHQMEAGNGTNDVLRVLQTSPETVSPSIDSVVTTRGYDFKSLERKRFSAAQVQMQCLSGQQGEYSISFSSEDPDDSNFLGTTTDMLGGVVLSPTSANEAETANIRCRVGGLRGITGTLTLTRTLGSPKIHSITLSGTVTNRQTISQK
jgi:hypothetical protein